MLEKIVVLIKDSLVTAALSFVLIGIIAAITKTKITYDNYLALSRVQKYVTGVGLFCFLIFVFIYATPLFYKTLLSLDIDNCLDRGGAWDEVRGQCDYGEPAPKVNKP